MKIKSLLLWSIFIIVVGVILAFSTWHQWNANQKTTLERMRPIPPIAEFHHGSWIRDIAFSPKHPDLVASVGEHSIIKVWNRNNTDSPELTLTNHPTNESGTSGISYITFTQTGEWLVSKDFWMVAIWDASSGERINTLETPSSTGVVSPMNDYLAAGTRDVKLWDISNPNKISELFILPVKMGEQSISHEEVSIKSSNHNSWVKHHNATVNQSFKTIDFSHDGKWIAAGGEIYDKPLEKWSSKLKIWDLQNQQLFRIIERDDPKNLEPKRKGKKVPSFTLPPSNDIRSIKFSPDSRFFGLAADNGLTIWTLPEWEIYHEVLDKRIRDIAFSPDGTMFAITDIKGITLWSVETLAPIALLQKVGLIGSSVIEFSPDGNMLAGGGFGGVLRLWDVRKLNEK
ncbi:MAG: hypothetical protein OXI43_13290 [Candidatus Poribacteria bacterium]|nr:hypothetical protein [Candidatus Poribacteria bacterium]